MKSSIEQPTIWPIGHSKCRPVSDVSGHSVSLSLWQRKEASDIEMNSSSDYAHTGSRELLCVLNPRLGWLISALPQSILLYVKPKIASHALA